MYSSYSGFKSGQNENVASTYNTSTSTFNNDNTFTYNHAATTREKYLGAPNYFGNENLT